MSDLSEIIQGSTIVDFAESHPMMLIGIICVLVLLIVAYCVYSYMPSWFSSEKLASGKKNSSKYLDDDDEIDNLVSSIREKQKRNIGGAK